MKAFKVLPLTLAVASTLGAFAASAASEADLQSLEQRISELEARTQTTYQNDQQPAVLSPDFEAPLGIIFSGYARYGAHYKAGDERYVNIGTTGRSVGRLGNESNGGEFQFAKVFDAEDGGPKWDLVLMFDHWSNSEWGSEGGVNLKKMYAGVTNVFESQRDLYMWAGRDFHQRPQQGINDYFWMSHDGQGAGFYNLNLGGIMLDMGFVGQVADDNGALGDDSGRYAVTSKIHGIDAGIGGLELYANYGFASSDANSVANPNVDDETAWQVGAVLGLGESNRIVAKYADGADDSVFDLAGDKQVIYVSLEGAYTATDNFIIDYLASYKDISGDDSSESSEYSAIVRPQYQWDSVHSTWLEAGYAYVDYDNNDEDQGWKVTLSQNVSLGGLPWSRPQLRFYATVGDVESTRANVSNTVDTVSFGAMFEAWW